MKQYWIVGASIAALSACSGAQTGSSQAGLSTVANGPEEDQKTSTLGLSSGEQPSTANSEKTEPGADPRASSTSTASDVPDEGRTSSKLGVIAPLPAGTKVLHIGDSFAGALGVPLGVLLEKAAVKSVLKHTDASYLTDWAWNGDLQKYLWKYNPDLLIITLGANELAIAEPEQREKTIKKITSLVGDRPCLWVAIPLWQGKHNGLMDVIRDNAGPCIYWDSNALLDVEHMARISDGVHPTTEARAAWAQVVFDWLGQHRAVDSARPWDLRP